MWIGQEREPLETTEGDEMESLGLLVTLETEWHEPIVLEVPTRLVDFHDEWAGRHGTIPANQT